MDVSDLLREDLVLRFTSNSHTSQRHGFFYLYVHWIVNGLVYLRNY